MGLTLDYDFVLKTIKTSIDVVMFFNHTYMTEIYFNPAEKRPAASVSDGEQKETAVAGGDCLGGRNSRRGIPWELCIIENGASRLWPALGHLL